MILFFFPRFKQVLSIDLKVDSGNPPPPSDGHFNL